jgi:hypothetical protein
MKDDHGLSISSLKIALSFLLSCRVSGRRFAFILLPLLSSVGIAGQSIQWLREANVVFDVDEQSNVVSVSDFAIVNGDQRVFRALLEKSSSEGSNLWKKEISFSSNQLITWVADLKLDRYGNIYVAYPVWSPFGDPNGGQVEKYSSAGELAWRTKTAAGGRMAVDPSGIYVTGNVLLQKLDHTGNILWTLSGSCQGTSVALFTNSFIYVCGTFNGKQNSVGSQTLLSEDDAYPNAFVAKLTLSGDAVWARGIASPYPLSIDQANGLAVDQDGSICVTGTFTPNNGSKSDAFVTRFNSDGDMLWNLVCSGTDQNLGSDVAIDIRGNLYVIGMYDGTPAKFGDFVIPVPGFRDFFLAKVTKSGEVAWVQTGNGNMNDWGVRALAKGEELYFSLRSWSSTLQLGSLSVPGLVHGEAKNIIGKLKLLADAQASGVSLSAELRIGLTISGEKGKEYTIECAEQIGANWIALTNLTLSSPIETWVDPRPATTGKRLYRAVQLSP